MWFSDQEKSIPPEYSFLFENEMDDPDKDPDFNPTLSSDESDQEKIVHETKLTQKLRNKNCALDNENINDNIITNQASPEKAESSGLNGVFERHEKIKILDIRRLKSGIVVADLNQVSGSSEITLEREIRNNQTGRNIEEDVGKVERLKGRDYQNSISVENFTMHNSEIADRNQELVHIQDTQVISTFVPNVQRQQQDNINEDNNLEVMEHDMNDNNGKLEEIEPKKKRPRSLENQMINNRNKHPIRQPCSCKMKCLNKITPEDRLLINMDYGGIYNEFGFHLSWLRTF